MRPRAGSGRRRSHAVGDGTGDDHPADAVAPEPCEVTRGIGGAPGAGELEADHPPPGQRQGRRVGRDAIAAGHVGGDPGVGPEARVGAGQLARVRRRSRRAGRRARRGRTGTTTADAPREDGEHRYEREDVAVEMGLLRHQREPVATDEREQDEVRRWCAAAAPRRRRRRRRAGAARSPPRGGRGRRAGRSGRSRTRASPRARGVARARCRPRQRRRG